MRGVKPYVTLGVGDEIFAIDVTSVHEILDFGPVARLPNAPPHVLGMIDVRRRAVPVVDLRVRLGLEPTQRTEFSRILVIDIKIDRRVIVLGLLADRVYEVANLADQVVEPAPDIGTRWRSDYIQGITRRGDDFIIIFDLSRLFSSEEMPMVGEMVSPD